MGACFPNDWHYESKGDIATLVLRVTGRKGALARRYYFGVTYIWVDRQYSPHLSVIYIKNYLVDQYSQQLPFFMRVHPIYAAGQVFACGFNRFKWNGCLGLRISDLLREARLSRIEPFQFSCQLLRSDLARSVCCQDAVFFSIKA